MKKLKELVRKLLSAFFLNEDEKRDLREYAYYAKQAQKEKHETQNGNGTRS